MKDFRIYSPEDAINENLREISGRFDAFSEQEIAHLRELARLIVESEGDQPDFLTLLPDDAPHGAWEDGALLAENEPAVRELRGIRDNAACVLLCAELEKILSEKFPLSPAFFFPATANVPEDAAGKITYQKNTYSDKAFLTFSGSVASPRAAYAGSFASACEDVFNGASEYCILPVESSAEGSLSGFSRLIGRYGLKIAATCDIHSSDTQRFTRFALLRKNLTPVCPGGKESLFFELSLPLAGSPTPAELLTAADLLGHTVSRLHTLPAPDAPEPSLRMVLRTRAGTLSAFFLYLAMVAPHCEALGLYPHLGEKE